MTELFKTIKNEYNLGEIISIEDINGGYLTTNYKIATESGTYFLKQHRHLDEHVLKYITYIEQLYKENDIPVIASIENIHKKLYFYHDGKWYTLYPFVNLQTTPRNELTTNHAKSMGVLQAKLHLIGEKADKSIFPERSTDLKSEKFITRYDQIKNILDNKAIKDKYDEITMKSLEIKKELQKTVPYFQENIELKNDCIIHGDFQSLNMFFDKTGNIINIFDCEKPEYAPRYFELIRSIDYSFFNNGINDTCYEHAEAYLHAYNSVSEINEKLWRQTLKAYIISKVNNLWIENEHYVKNNNRVDDLIELTHNSIMYFADNYKYFVEKLSKF